MTGISKVAKIEKGWTEMEFARAWVAFKPKRDRYIVRGDVEEYRSISHWGLFPCP